MVLHRRMRESSVPRCSALQTVCASAVDISRDSSLRKFRTKADVPTIALNLRFAHRTGISFRKQLVTQIVLGIVGGDLVPGERLPSTRELSRRFRVHPNTLVRPIRNWSEICGSNSAMEAEFTSENEFGKHCLQKLQI